MNHPITIKNHSFNWPNLQLNHNDTILLKLTAKINTLGKLLFPYITITVDNNKTSHYFSKHSNGSIYLNLSNLANSISPTTIVKINSAHLTYAKTAELVVFRNNIPATAKILLISPHPDDATLAAFAFCSNHNTTIATITAGEQGEMQIPDNYSRSIEAKNKFKGKLRVISSMAAAMLGNIPPQNIISLEHHDGKVTPNKKLIAELETIIQTLQPKIIALPHPTLDKNPDHRASTIATLQALKNSKLAEGKLLFYIIHNSHSHKYPYGPQGTPVTLPPNTEATTLYSYPLTIEQQTEKLYALDAIYGLRPSPNHLCTIRQALTQKLRRAPLNYNKITPWYNYFRKFVRANELFITTSYNEVDTILAKTKKS